MSMWSISWTRDAARMSARSPDKCVGCGKCARNCPAGAIIGAKKMPHKIVTDACIRCGSCQENCAFDAIYIEY